MVAFAYSLDGLHWKALKGDRSFLHPNVDKGIGYAHSKDLIHWSEQKFIPVMAHESTVKNTWAPEITYDDKNSKYMIYWASTIPEKFTETASTLKASYNHCIYYVTTKDFNTFSETKLLYDLGFNSIEAIILKDRKRWVMFIKMKPASRYKKILR